MTATIVLDFGLGDAGKGTVTEWTTRQQSARWNIRFNGGAQAAHNVVRPDGTHHTFQQFGSGTFEGAATFLSKNVIVHPLRLIAEAQALQDKGIPFPLSNHFIDERALVITPYHIALNQLKERSRGINRHGSTGLGVGETRAFAIKHPNAMKVSDLRHGRVLAELMRDTAELVVKEAQEYDSSAAIDENGFRLNVMAYQAAGQFLQAMPDDFFDTKVAPDGNLIFEGAQGVLLDEKFGMPPHNTWSNTTSGNALALLKDYPGEVKTIGVMRPYMTRHGAGPLPTEDAELSSILSESHNTGDEWTGPMRYGYLDCALLRYAIRVSGGIDEIALTHTDEIPKLPNKVAWAYSYKDQPVQNVAALLSHDEFNRLDGNWPILTARLAACTPLYMPWRWDTFTAFRGISITLTSHGPTIDDKIEHPVSVRA